MSSGDNGVSNNSGSTSSAGTEVGDMVAIKALPEMDDGEEKRGEDEHGEEKEEQRAQEDEKQGEGHEEEDISRISLTRRQAAAISKHY
ncbi:unnamed protein product, partial [Ectocarpus sp. 12 AP-2014]